MSQDLKNSKVLALAELLKGKEIKSSAVAAALELLCKSALFEYGLIYELDRPKIFTLKENYASAVIKLPKYLAPNNVILENKTYWLEKGVHYINKNQPIDSLQVQLLELCSAHALLFAPLIDDKKRIYGFVGLFNIDSTVVLDDDDEKILVMMLYMLIRYLEGRMYQRRIKEILNTMESILNNTGIDVYVNDLESHDILYVNESMAAPYGGRESFIGRKCWEVLFPGQTAPCSFCPKNKIVDENGVPTKVYSWDYQRPFDKAWFRVFSAAFQWGNGRMAHVVSSADISENKQNEAMIERLANFDQLTKLPNRRMLVKECERRIDQATAEEKGYLLFFDIDGFKAINDNYGHDAGDEFLIQVSEFFSDIDLLRENIYRNGGDEFIAIIGGESVGKDCIRDLAKVIHRRFDKPWQLTKGDVFCNISIGVACYPEDGIAAEALLKKADQAMYKVKKSGGAGLCFGYQL